jgi:myo-inositol-1(or 4)-monophosphatase
MHLLLNIAIRAARRAGESSLSIPRLESLEVTAKGRNDFVSEVDHAAEREIIDIIRRHYPEHAILAEKAAPGEHETRWIIDPPTAPPTSCTASGIRGVDRLRASRQSRDWRGLRRDAPGSVTATRGRRAPENWRMRVSKQRGLEGALIATGFPYRADGGAPSPTSTCSV